MILIITFFIVFLSAEYTLLNNKGQKLLCTLLGLLLTTIAALRSEDTGYDYQQYLSLITLITSYPDFLSALDLTSRIEPLFVSSSYAIANIIGLSNLYIIILYSILGIMIKVISFKKLSPLPVVSLLLYFQSQYFYSDFAQIRQSVAMSFFLLAVYFILNKKNKLSILCVIIAICSHYSAIVCLGIYPLAFLFNLTRKKIAFYSLFVFLLLSIIFSFLDLKLSSYLAQIIPIDIITKKIEGYSETEYAQPISFGISDITRILTCLLIYCFILKTKYNHDLMLSIFYISGCIIFFLLKNDGILASRITSYFKILDCIILAKVIYNYLPYRKNIIFAIKFMLISLILFTYSTSSFYKNVINTPEIYNFKVIN